MHQRLFLGAAALAGAAPAFARCEVQGQTGTPSPEALPTQA